MKELMKAADPELFRVKVGRFHERWYTDPQPTCAIAAASDWRGPSISAVKKASGSDWTNVAIRRIAASDADTFIALAAMEPDERAKWLRDINTDDLKVAAGRGTIVHYWAEQMLLGDEPTEPTALDLAAWNVPAESLPEAKLYLNAIRTWFDKHQPELIGKEIVVFNRALHGYGYGGTADAWVKINGQNVAIDWKTRTRSSRHGAYAEEGAQIAAACNAEYCIIDIDGVPGRARIPKFDHGLVVSIKPEGCETFPIDLAAAQAHWVAMHAWWTARRDETRAIQKAMPKETAAIDTLVARAKQLKAAGHGEQLVAAWPANYPALSKLATADETQLKRVDEILAALEAEHEMPFMAAAEPAPKAKRAPKRQAAAPRPDDTEHADEKAVEKLEAHVAKLNDQERAWLNHQTAAAKADGYSVSITQVPSVRRFEIGRALLAFAKLTDVDDMFNCALNTVGSPDGSLGQRVGTLTKEQAEQLVVIARHIHNGDPVVVTPENTLTLESTNV